MVSFGICDEFGKKIALEKLTSSQNMCLIHSINTRDVDPDPDPDI